MLPLHGFSFNDSYTVSNVQKNNKSSYFSTLAGTFQDFIWESFVSGISSSSGISAIQTVKNPWPENVPYFTFTSAFRAPRVSDPSTYTDVQLDETLEITYFTFLSLIQIDF